MLEGHGPEAVVCCGLHTGVDEGRPVAWESAGGWLRKLASDCPANQAVRLEGQIPRGLVGLRVSFLQARHE